MQYISQLCLAITLSAMAVGAQATIYEYSVDDPSGSAAGGDIKNITTSYNDANSKFSWEYTIEDKNDGFWLVVSDGQNPKGVQNQLAILYGDLNKNVLTAYQYNGANSNNSYNDPGVKLGQWKDILTTTVPSDDLETTSFSIDASVINGAIGGDWEGIQFGKKLGIWFHTSTGSKFKYNENGYIKEYGYKAQGYHDSANNMTEEPQDPNEVPVPSALLLLALGLLSMAFVRRQAS